MSKTQKQTTQFVKGLVTEAGELTFPEGASVDELNCDLSRKGSRRRRLGIAFEDNYVLSDDVLSTASTVSTGTWDNVSGVAGLQFLVIQINEKLVFYDKSKLPLSAQAVPTSLVDPSNLEIDLSDFEVSGQGGGGFNPVSLTTHDGRLIVASQGIEAFVIERDITTEAFTTTLLSFKVRDFEFQGDRTDYEIQFSNPSAEREYDTANTGWSGTLGSAALTSYKSAHSGDYPPLTHAWFTAKEAATGAFNTALFDRVWSGTSQIANGHYVLDLFNKDRSTASGVAGLTPEVEPSRFKTLTTYAGRVWFSGLTSSTNSSKVFFSSIKPATAEYGFCYQNNDPTSEAASLLDTDGGEITISGAHNVSSMAVLGASLVVFAENGVWSISGVDDVFRATEFSVRKITDIGLTNPKSFVDAEGSLMWWSPSGIHVISPDKATGRLSETDISISTIQTFWNEIGAEERGRCVAEYDYVSKKVYWLFPSVGETNDQKYNRALILDTVLQAFYPWTVSDSETDTSYIIGASFFKGVGSEYVSYDVVDNSGNLVVDSSDSQVQADILTQLDTGNSEIRFIVRDGDSGKITFADFSSTSFLDWGDADYSSYAESGYDFNGDISSKKSAPFVSVVMGVTEEGWSGNVVDGYERVRPSSLKVRAYWDFNSRSSTTAQQAYRLKSIPVVDADDLTKFDYPSSVVTTRLKLRGRGRSVRLRFESEEGKDFNLLGWEMIGDRSNKL